MYSNKYVYEYIYLHFLKHNHTHTIGAQTKGRQDASRAQRQRATNQDCMHIAINIQTSRWQPLGIRLQPSPRKFTHTPKLR